VKRTFKIPPEKSVGSSSSQHSTIYLSLLLINIYKDFCLKCCMVVLCRYGEIFLKGKNRPSFEHALVRNIHGHLKKQGIFARILMKRNRLLIEGEVGDCSFLKRVFGLVSFSVAERVELVGEKIVEMVLRLIENENPHSFKINTQRTTKTGKLNSVQLNELVGAIIVGKRGWKVNLTNPDLIVGIEVIDNYAYVFTQRENCVGGLPVGVSGKVGVDMDHKYSELAALLMMKRGCGIFGLSKKIEAKSDFLLMAPFLLNECKLFPIKDETFLPMEETMNQRKVAARVSASLEPIEKINNNQFILTPLIGKTVQECDELVRYYEGFC
jgi:tRNA(Ser,Leu) C12 N-acetylase TAN1